MAPPDTPAAIISHTKADPHGCATSPQIRPRTGCLRRRCRPHRAQPGLPEPVGRQLLGRAGVLGLDAADRDEVHEALLVRAQITPPHASADGRADRVVGIRILGQAQSVEHPFGGAGDGCLPSPTELATGGVEGPRTVLGGGCRQRRAGLCWSASMRWHLFQQLRPVADATGTSQRRVSGGVPTGPNQRNCPGSAYLNDVATYQEIAVQESSKDPNSIPGLWAWSLVRRT